MWTGLFSHGPFQELINGAKCLFTFPTMAICGGISSIYPISRRPAARYSLGSANGLGRLRLPRIRTSLNELSGLSTTV